MYPRLEINLRKLQQNAAVVVARAAEHDIEIWGVTKVLQGPAPVAQALLSAGVTAIAEARVGNLQRLQAGGVNCRRVLLRLPAPSKAHRVVTLADISLNSQLPTLRALNQAALRAGVRHGVLLMVDLGDLREGIWPDDLPGFAKQAARLPGLRLLGLGTNLTCFGGVMPSPSNLGQLVNLARHLESQGIMQSPIVSGGNSSSWRMLEQGQIPPGINNLRLGEAILFGREALERAVIPGLHTDAFVLSAEVIEVNVKPSVPIGRIAQDAFGHVPSFTDRGMRRRAILALGRQDVEPEGLLPLQPGIEVIGASSDHLVLDTTDFAGEVMVGQVFTFVPNYSALLRLSSSTDLEVDYRQ